MAAGREWDYPSEHWEKSTIPVVWPEATIIPILKPSKSGLDPLHYRQIITGLLVVQADDEDGQSAS